MFALDRQDVELRTARGQRRHTTRRTSSLGCEGVTQLTALGDERCDHVAGRSARLRACRGQREIGLREVPERRAKPVVNVIAVSEGVGICQPTFDLGRKRHELGQRAVEGARASGCIGNGVHLHAARDEKEREEYDDVIEGELVHAGDGKSERRVVSRGSSHRSIHAWASRTSILRINPCASVNTCSLGESASTLPARSRTT